MVAVGGGEGRVFLGGEHPLPMVFPLFKIRVAVFRGLFVGESAVGVFGFRLKVSGVHLLDLPVQGFIGRPVIPPGQQHGQHAAGFQQGKGLGEGGFLRDPLDGGGGIDHVKALGAEIVGDEIIVHDMEIFIRPVFLPHLFKQVLPQLDGMVIAPGAQDGVRGLAGAGADLQHPFPRPDPGKGNQIREQRLAVPGPETVKLLRDQIKHFSEFHGRGLLQRGFLRMALRTSQCKHKPRGSFHRERAGQAKQARAIPGRRLA